ncbi:MAG: type VII secretion protein EccB, partial [Pseudonocardiales bacterium]|nr:type VII secretion protein EccB [Pseudonocardiales bacterium]
MSSTIRAPATRDQADAYRFGLRRLEAALVRGDPVPLHEQIRSQRRASFAGVVLGMLGLCGVAGYALVVPSPNWT